MSHRRSKPPTLTEALVATFADPSGTALRLLGSSARPRYAVASAAVFIAVSIAPPLLSGGYRGGSTIDGEYIGSITMTILLTCLCGSLLVAFSIHAIGSKNTYLRTTAALAYSSAPITVTLALLYIISQISMGSCTVVTFLSTGVALPDDYIVRMYPRVFRAALMVSFVALAQGLRVVSRASLWVGCMMAALAVFLFMGSFIIGLAVTDLVYPSTSSRTIEFLLRYFAYPR